VESVQYVCQCNNTPLPQTSGLLIKEVLLDVMRRSDSFWMKELIRKLFFLMYISKVNIGI
jgi:hypothetical protein